MYTDSVNNDVKNNNNYKNNIKETINKTSCKYAYTLRQADQNIEKGSKKGKTEIEVEKR